MPAEPEPDIYLRGMNHGRHFIRWFGAVLAALALLTAGSCEESEQGPGGGEQQEQQEQDQEQEQEQEQQDQQDGDQQDGEQEEDGGGY
ncbi:hypothetical protein SAMN04487820_101310 [Actinopolyspora mzabensis]|uniref:Uncharacterized protein n=2 Tax=Actinopolyspora mzabensis TaxID=995066 RepID=A0A1G8VT34_ACTMZ|nr:hypothetical protein SAMN04487820_101310 [Actinopolyspora mzabensis]